MKRLLLLRHAKAMPSERGMADRDRPLAPRGHRDAVLMGKAIAADPPNLILCSPAKRTRETLAAIIDALDAEPHVLFVDALYGATDDYIRIIAAKGGDAASLLVIGHNPTIHATAVSLIGTGERQARAALSAKYPTAALAIFGFDIGAWSEIRAGTGELVAFQRPRDFGSVDADD